MRISVYFMKKIMASVRAPDLFLGTKIQLPEKLAFCQNILEITWVFYGQYISLIPSESYPPAIPAWFYQSRSFKYSHQTCIIQQSINIWGEGDNFF